MDILAAEAVADQIIEANLEEREESSDDNKSVGPLPIMTQAEMQDPENREQLITAHRRMVKRALTRFIKYNHHLYHFDLSHTGLNEGVLKKVGASLSKARALVTLHLSGNPGINDRNLKYLKKRIRCKSQRPYVHIDWTPIEADSSAKKPSTK